MSTTASVEEKMEAIKVINSAKEQIDRQISELSGIQQHKASIAGINFLATDPRHPLTTRFFFSPNTIEFICTTMIMHLESEKNELNAWAADIMRQD